MRELLAAVFVLIVVRASDIGLNLPCNRELDGLLAADPDGNPSAFLSCQSNGVGSLGYWERRVCPDDMAFDFINQQCQQRKHRKQPMLNIAILNNSCAHGETCIGGTVCDLERLRCLCPFGTVPQLETLSCIKPQSTYTSFGNYEKSPSTPAAFLPNPSQTNPPPFTFNFSPLFGKEPFTNTNYGNQNSKYGNVDNVSNKEHASFPNGNNYGANGQWGNTASGSGNSNGGLFGGANTFNELLPKSAIESQPFVFQPNFFASTTAPAISTKKVPTLARPGQSCRENEMCIGGSICTHPIALCLCPGELEEKDGECVLPPSATIQIEKVGIGALCSELAECDHGSTCVMGRCTCVAPLVQHEGRCVLRQERKEVGPGELCDNGEICVRGSVCDTVIPVCVCPPNTDLSNGDCVHISSIKPIIVASTSTVMPPTAAMSEIPPPLPATQLPAQPRPVFIPSTTLAPVFVPSTTQIPQQPMQPFGGQYGQSQNVHQEKPMTAPIYPAQPNQVTYANYQSSMPPPTMRPNSKLNHMKISLGGSKQSGVGVPCSLNTDCMIGAYCNGNTNPPSCQCLSTHVNIEGRCERVVYPGQVGCRSDLQCSAAYTGTTCVDRICVCPKGFKEVDQTCVPEYANRNEKCGYLNGLPECSKGFSCIDQICVCPTTHTITNGFCSSNTIDPLTQCDEACEPPKQCQNNRCVCPDGVMCAKTEISRRYRRGVVEQSMVCWPGASRCSAGNGICIDNVCHCVHGFVEVDGVCAPEVVRINEKCDPNGISPRCPGNTVCKDGICQCTTPDECDRDSFMVGSRSMDGRCVADRECQDGRCIAGRCQCNAGFTLQNGVCTSTIGAFKNINSQCAAADRCSGGSTCRENICQCVDGSSELHGRCRQSPGGRCSYGQTCDGGSSCEFGLCRCPEGHIVDSGKCVMGKAEPGKSCQHGQKCVHGSVCRFGMCVCIAKYIASKGRCVRRENVLVPSRPKPSSTTPSSTTLMKVGSVKGPGFECQEGDLCSGGSRCRDGFCVCNEFEVIINDQCVGSHKQANEIIDKLLVSAPGQPCEAKTNCTGGSVCINRTCTCEQGTIDNTGTCGEGKKEYGSNAAPPKKSPDQFQPGFTCTLTLECPYRTECIRGVCRCKKGETIVENTCRKAIHQVLPGGKCDPRKGYDCVGEAHCFYGVCTCTRQLVNNGKECATIAEIEMVMPGKRCGPGQTCSGGARCLDGICRCSEDEVPDVNKKCVKKSQVYPVFNKYPATSETTTVYYPNTVSVTLSSTSANPTLSVDKMKELEAFEALLKANPSFSEVDPKLPKTIYGHICRSKDECPANSFCFHQLCRCMIGYYAAGGYCQPIADTCATPTTPGKPCSTTIAHPGEDCTKSQVCSFNSYCGLFSGVCECPSGMATVNGRCERTTATPGLGCVTSKNCHNSSYCDNGLCLCKTGFRLVNNFCEPAFVGGAVPSTTIKQSNPQDVSTMLRSFQSYPASLIPLDFTKPPFNFPSNPEIKTVYGNANSQQMTPPLYAQSQMPKFQSFPIPSAKGASTRSGDVISEGAKPSLRLRVAMPGDYCGDNSICIGNSLCQKQFCRCPPNTYAENGICSIRKRMSPGSQHSNDHEDFGNIDSQEDSVESRQFAEPLENCQNFEFCTGGSECSNIQGMGLVCQCPVNTIFLEDECVDTPRNADLVGIGESCHDGEICLGGSRCIQNICMCDEDKHDILGICVTTARPGDDCSDGQICVDGAVCAASAKTCVCPPGRISKLGRCVESGQLLDNALEMGSPGKICGRQTTCGDNSFCSGEGICMCMPRFTNVNGRCVPSSMVRNPGEECQLDNICAGGSMCREGACSCPLGNLLIEEKCVRMTDEIRRRPSKSECEIDTDCPEHYQCVNNMCVCHGSFARCLRMVLLRAEHSCREDAHCPEHATCNENLCVCDDGYKMVQGVCAQRDSFKRMVTMKGTKTVKDTKMKITKPSGPGAVCDDSHHCTMGSVCFHGHCVCGLESVPRNGSCVPRSGNIGVKERCSELHKCYDTLVCIQNRCACPSDSLSCNENEPVTSPPGGACTDSRICVGGSVCREGWCICPDPTMIVQRGICIQSGPRPTLPPSPTSVFSQVQQKYLPNPAYQTVAAQSIAPTATQFNIPQGRKIPPGSNCGPFDSCVGGAMCVDGLCVCPPGMQASAQGRCETSTSTTSSAAILNPGTPMYARPGQQCANGETCVAGSVCNEVKVCACPPEKPVLQGDSCVAQTYRKIAAPGESCDENTECTQESSCQGGQCRCKYGYIAVSGQCVALPMPSTPTMKNVVLAKPLDSCDNGELCEGGSSCDQETGVCMCPPGYIVFGVQCQPPPLSTAMTPLPQSAPTYPASFNTASPECVDDTNCGVNKVCVVGRCKCKPGFVDHDGVCEPLEKIELGERPVPVSYAKHKVETLSSERIVDPAEFTDSTTMPVIPSPRTPSRQETQRPRIVGPPIRRPRPKSKGSSGTTLGSYKTGSGNGACPPGNEPTRDDDGRLIMCNGLEPNCPPRSYCYITSGGFASEEYNCCKSCDTCTQGSTCIDMVCKCGPGFALSPNGWCERFEFNLNGRTTSSFQENYFFTTTTTTLQPIIIEAIPDEHPLFETTAAQSSFRPKVIRHRFLGTKCRDNDVCINGGECRDGVCRCPDKLYERDGRCLRADQLPRAAPSESCAKGEMCTGGSICDNDSKICICAANHVIVDGICRSKDAAPFAAPGQSCSRGEDCSGGSFCTDGICQCDSYHFIEDGYCRHIASRSSEIRYEAGNGLRFSSKAFTPRPPATICNEATCRLPDCFCSVTGRKPPGGLAPNTVPQFVVLTFDDAVNGRTLPDYRELFETVKYRNPNGCPVKGTFFVSHEWTNYDAVQWLFQQGMELASNSISHVSLEGTSADRWLNEMDGQRRIMAKFANANEEEIVGMRAPQLALGGDEQFEMMARAGFLYDNSMSANPGVNGDPFWPQTLDHLVPWDCYDANCPKSSFPGVWSVPLNQFYGTYLPQIDSFRRSSMIRAAVDLNTTVDQLTNMLFSNFDRSYTASRAPFVLALNADLLQLNGRNTGMQALQRFLEEILYRKDVYVVTLKQLIHWMKNPVPLSQIAQSDAVKCSQEPMSQYPAISRRFCSKPNKCMYRTPGLSSQEHQFLTCSPCPDQYPWLDNPIGNMTP
ncbi:hypothetical protein RB195_021339 [Necator americanus]|uniref:EGF-like domain-containing protein n=1 Tax=Necator americanus TaxID=51031 RepID=A0ABR1EAH8_NECAM